MHPPLTVRHLTRNVDAYARSAGVAPGRVRSWVSFMVIGGALLRGEFAGRGPRFTIKGGVALELRLRTVARATKDLDLMCVSSRSLASELGTALATPYEGFSFRLRGDGVTMPNGALRVE